MAALVTNKNPLPDVEVNPPNYTLRKKGWNSRLHIKKMRSSELRKAKIIGRAFVCPPPQQYKTYECF